MFCRTSVRSWGEVKDSKLSYLWSGIIDRGRMQGAWSKSDGDSKIARALGGTRYTFIVHETHCGCLAVGSGTPSPHAKSPQPKWVCGLAWNSGVAGIRSVAVGLHDVLGVGELVELIDVGLGNHDVDGREHE